MDGFSYIPGTAREETSPLTRFLPPIPEGIAAAFLSVHAAPGSWVLDPFGASPRLVLEMARAGYRVLVAVNNPVTRFLLEMAADPIPPAEFKAALSTLAAARKGQERLEAHIRSLYSTQCRKCQQEVQVEAYVWERGAELPVARIYTCSCGESGEFPVEAADLNRVRQVAASDGLHRSRALERVAAPDDPDRPHAVEALACYLPRAVYVLTTLINKLDGLDLPPLRRRALFAILLAAFDDASTLWPTPSERPRPKQLTTPPRFLEKNIWTALEQAENEWGCCDPVPKVNWPELPPEGGGICIFEGPLRHLGTRMEAVTLGAVASVLPRPNQAFWTLSALWAGWLWGREAIAQFKSVLRRRRYDWNWHAGAMYAAMKNLYALVPMKAPVFALLPEAEPSFLSAAMLAGAGAGFDLSGLALRTRHDPIEIVWHRRAFSHEERSDKEIEIDPQAVAQAMQAAAQARGEPQTYLHLHAAGLAAMAGDRSLHWREEALARVHAPIQAALGSPGFIHYSESQNLEVGLWGLEAGEGTQDPLPDRVEVTVVRHLQKHPGASLREIEIAVNAEFPGLLTPSLGLLRAILDSYALESGGTWSLRSEDSPAGRREDLESAEAALTTLAARLGYAVVRQEAPHRYFHWQEPGRPVYRIHLIASVVVGRILRMEGEGPGQALLVLPGGRSSLLAYKIERDPSLRLLAQAWKVLKFRHLRELAGTIDMDREGWGKELSRDPVEPPEQMKLF